VATHAVNDQPGLRINIAGPRHDLPGFLNTGWQDDADVPFQIGNDLPFEDGAVQILIVGGFVATLAHFTRVHFLLECRRTLCAGGVLRIAPAGLGAVVPDALPAVTAHEIARIAALVGLEPTRRASSALGDAAGPATSLEYTRPDRRVVADPLVSLLIPAYNPRFFAACIATAQAQTYDNLEIVVCDDSSGTEIETMCRTLSGHRPVRYERNEARLSPRGNFTRCLERAQGEFIKFLCDDDLLAPPCVASLLDAFRRAPHVTLAATRRLRIDSEGDALADQPATIPMVAASSVIVGYTLANAMLMAGLNTVGEPSTTLFRKADLLDQAPTYFCFNGVAGHGIIDMVTWAALLLKGDAVYLTERLSSFRVHPGQRQHDPSKRQRNIDSIRSLQAAWLELGLQSLLPPNLLLTKPFPPSPDAEWRQQPVLGVAAHRVR
jgi:Glycosyl transferase family 2